MKKNSKRTKRVRNLVLVCILSALLLTVSTYAWFVGLQTVRVNSFEINIASTNGLALSLDGVNWSSELEATKDTAAYTGNTNQWLTEIDEDGDLISKGLIPMSSVGDIDLTTSKLKLYEKGSLTAKDGGYRLLTSQVENSSSAEKDGYVAFDLFIRNMSGEAYYAEDNVLNEEAIYLTYDSDVTVGTAGVKDTGIENSVRVAFAQIGRVKNADYTADTASTVTGITCADTYEDDGKTKPIVTGICRTAQIWEPNDTNHVPNAISFYNESCTQRTTTAEDSTDGFTYEEKTESSGLCGKVENNQAYPTYAISRAIAVADYVDIYDGASFNKYITNTVEPGDAYKTYLNAKNTAEDFDAQDYKLVAVDTFTETERGKAGDASTPTGAKRNVFMTLAPNSITKVRVYVYIEGQDIDNYDFAQLGKAIQVNFGFTKERYTTDDYTDEPVTIIPGAENVQEVPYEPTGEISDVTNAVWDATNKEFVTLNTYTGFEFKDEDTAKEAVYTAETGWTIKNKSS